MDDKWHKRFFEAARLSASWSKDPSSKSGAVITDDRNVVVAGGYNGFPRGVADDGRYQDRALKYEMIVHAEVNAILNAEGRAKGGSMYVYPYPPCSRCAAVIIQAGIKKVYVLKDDYPERWRENLNLAAGMLKEAGVRLIFIEP